MMKENKIKNKHVGAGPVSASNKGITLIALIITIIVMLILVGVTISVLINSNLIGATKTAANSTKDNLEKEGHIEDYVTVGNETLNDYLANLQNNSGNGGGTNTGSIEPGQRAKNGNKSYKNVTIPEGFTVSGIAEESNSIEDGIVIYDIPSNVDTSAENFWTATTTVGIATDVPTVQTLYNQYVWVPVEKATITKAEIEEEIRKTNQGEYTAEEYEAAAQAITQSLKAGNASIYPMAIECENGNYRGLLYTFEAGKGSPVTVSLKQFSTTADYTASTVTYNREPAYLTSYDSNTSSYNTIGITQNSLQIEYNNIVRSVAENGGFFVARYELIKDGTEYGSKRGKTVASASSSSANMWYGLYSACQTLDNGHTDFVTSTMIYGSQWDQIMMWMKEVKNTNNTNNYYVTDSSYMGNYNASSGGTDSKKVSGYSNNYSVKKIFDLGGNLYDWTTEANLTNDRVLRGGNCTGNGSVNPASFRSNNGPGNTYSSYSARPTLYVNP